MILDDDMTTNDAVLVRTLQDAVQVPEQEPEPPQQSGIVMKVYHTRTEMKVYPNGMTFISKVQGWFENTTYQVKPKVKKTAEVTIAALQPTEAY